MIQAGLDCRWRNSSSRDSSAKTRNTPNLVPGSSGQREDLGDEVGNTPSLQDDRHLVCSPATSGFTLPASITGTFGRLAVLFFVNAKIKRRFYFWISPGSNTVSCSLLHMNCFVKFEFLIAWILGRGNWKQKVKTTNWPFSIFSFWFSKYWRMMFNFTFLSNKNWKLRS